MSKKSQAQILTRHNEVHFHRGDGTSAQRALVLSLVCDVHVLDDEAVLPGDVVRVAVHGTVVRR